MASKPRKVTKPTLVDPLFQIPLGAESEFIYSRDSSEGVIDTDAARGRRVSSPFGTFFDQSTSPTVIPNNLAAPSNLVVFDQKFRRTGDVPVVDIVAQFDEVPGAQSYEIRVIRL